MKYTHDVEMSLPLLAGYSIPVEATGNIYDDEVTELEIYWKRKSEADPLVPLPEILYDPDEATRIFYETLTADLELEAKEAKAGL